MLGGHVMAGLNCMFDFLVRPLRNLRLFYSTLCYGAVSTVGTSFRYGVAGLCMRRMLRDGLSELVKFIDA